MMLLSKTKDSLKNLFISHLLLMLMQNVISKPIEQGNKLSDECLEKYLDQITVITQIYEENIGKCLEITNETRLKRTRELEEEREQLIAGSKEVCARLEACEQLAEDMDFFQCQVDIGPENVAVLAQMNLNSTTALIKLHYPNEEPEKEALLCKVEAQRQHLQMFKDAHTEFIFCLNQNKSREDAI